MKRAVDALTSMFTSSFSPNKRLRENGGPTSVDGQCEDIGVTNNEPSSTPKRRHSSSRRKSSLRRSIDVAAELDALERLQTQLLDLDKQCSAEQLEIQRKFDSKKDPLIDARKSIIMNIPSFWKTAIGNHPATDRQAFALFDSFVLEYLRDIQISDNLDENGSYEIFLEFDHTNPYFSQTVLSRKTIVNDDFTETVEIYPTIIWAPTELGKPTMETSFFRWFSETTPLEPDFGEILRRDLWQNPYPYYLNMALK